MPERGRLVRHADLELLRGKVTKDGGELRQLSGPDYGLVTSVMRSEVIPGSGPRRHRHPHAEILILHEGQGRFEVEGTSFIGDASDIVIVPPYAWHSFVNSGTGPLRLTAIHQNPRAVTRFEDGTRRD